MDSSAIVAIALIEPEAKAFAKAISDNRCLIGWPTILETHLALKDRLEVLVEPFIASLLERPYVKLVNFDGELFSIARDAFDTFGKGRHPAKLNFGDCMSYAVAKHHDVALLFKGHDFEQTDIRSALSS